MSIPTTTFIVATEIWKPSFSETEIHGISGDVTSYIDTLQIPNSDNIVIELDIAFRTNDLSFTGVNSNGFLFIATHLGKFEFGIGSQRSFVGLQDNLRHTHKVEVSTGKYYRDGKLLNTITPDSIESINKTFLLMAINDPTNLTVFNKDILYGFKMWDNDELLVDLHSTLIGTTEFSTNPSPSDCMWDAVSETYFESPTGQIVPVIQKNDGFEFKNMSGKGTSINLGKFPMYDFTIELLLDQKNTTFETYSNILWLQHDGEFRGKLIQSSSPNSITIPISGSHFYGSGVPIKITLVHTGGHSGQIFMYVNGNLIVDGYQSLSTVDADWYLGTADISPNDNHAFIGTLSDITIFNYPKTSNTIISERSMAPYSDPTDVGIIRYYPGVINKTFLKDIIDNNDGDIINN